MPPRWRPPQPRSSPYITPEGERALRVELKSLWQKRRREVVPALSAAAAEGDRSENAEYIYRKKELAGIDRRIRYLQKRLPELTVVRETHNGDKIYFGATVEVCHDDGETHQRHVGVAIRARLLPDLDETDDRQERAQVPEPPHQQIGVPAPARQDRRENRGHRQGRCKVGPRVGGAGMGIEHPEVRGHDHLPDVGHGGHHGVGQALGQRVEKACQKTTVARVVCRIIVEIVFRFLLLRRQKLAGQNKDQRTNRATKILTAVLVERTPF